MPLRFIAAALTLLLVVLLASPRVQAQATASEEPDETVTACTQAFDTAQRHRQARALRAARRELLACGHERCPDLIKATCVGWLHDVDEELPSIVVVAKDVDGNDTHAVRVFVDGAPVADALDGAAILIDPGPHTLRFDLAGSPSIDKNVDIAVGVKNRVIEVSFEPPPLPVPAPALTPAPAPPSTPPPPPPAEPASSLLPVLIASGFGVAAVGGLVGTVVGVISLNRAAELERQCMTACSGDEIANGEAVSHVSTAGFVIGGVGAVVGTVALILYLRDDDDASSAIQLHVGRGSLQLEATF